MANLRNVRPVVQSPIRTASTPNARTATGGAGYLYADVKSELFDLGSVLFAGEETFHETAAHRNARYVNMVEKVAVSDPEWTYCFLIWQRHDGNIKTAPIMGAVHAVHARLKANSENSDGWNRKIISNVPVRLSDVKEIVSYWTSQFGSMPMCVKRGISDALGRLTSEYSYLKYGIQNNDNWTIPDIIEMVHPKPAKFFQSALYGYALADRHDNVLWEINHVPYTLKKDGRAYFSGLGMISAEHKLRKDFLDNPKVLLDPSRLKEAGFTWNDALSLAGNKLSKKALWESLITAGSIPVGAMLKNLRNMEEAGISRDHMKIVCEKLSNPEVIAKSHLMPYEIYAAYKNTNSVHWKSALEDAMTHATTNIPELKGRSVILVDASYSMVGAKLSNNSSLDRTEAAALFGAALAVKNAGRIDLHTFSDTTKPVPVSKGMSVLTLMENIMRIASTQGHGTRTVEAVRSTFRGHDRIIIITDEQSFSSPYGTIDNQIPADTFIYSFDVAGHRVTDIPSGKNKRHQMSGLTDGSFKIMALLERGRSSSWPWEIKETKKIDSTSEWKSGGPGDWNYFSMAG